MGFTILTKMAAILADNFKCIFLNENHRIPIRISLKFVPKSPIDNKQALVQVMAWRRTGDITWTNADPIHWRIYAALGWDELIYSTSTWRSRNDKLSQYYVKSYNDVIITPRVFCVPAWTEMEMWSI